MNHEHDDNQSGLEAKIEETFQRFTGGRPDFFEVLGLMRTATFREIESAYKNLLGEYKAEAIAQLVDPELKRKANVILEKFARAHDVLTNYEKRTEYEKRGFREAGLEDEKKDEPAERARVLYLKAKTLYSQQKFQLVISVMEEALKLDPDKADYFLLLGICQTQFPSLKRNAEENLLKAAELEPWNAEHFAALGMLFYSVKLMNRAESYFRKALALESHHSLAKAKLLEIAGPDKSTFQEQMEKAADWAKKHLPSVFKRKK